MCHAGAGGGGGGIPGPGIPGAAPGCIIFPAIANPRPRPRPSAAPPPPGFSAAAVIACPNLILLELVHVANNTDARSRVQRLFHGFRQRNIDDEQLRNLQPVLVVNTFLHGDPERFAKFLVLAGEVQCSNIRRTNHIGESADDDRSQEFRDFFRIEDLVCANKFLQQRFRMDGFEPHMYRMPEYESDRIQGHEA